MARLPIVGGDAGNWGTILNEYLQVSHNGDGTLKSSVVTGSVDANARVAVAKGGTTTGTRRKINFIEGTGVTITTTDDAANEKVDVTINASGSGGMADPGANGVVVRTATNTTTARTLTGTTNQITITNGDGVSGNPTFALPQDIATTSVPTFGGLNTNGIITAAFQNAATWSGGLVVRKRGTTGNANAAITSGSELGYHQFEGWDGTGFGRGAYAVANATQNFGTNAHGARYSIFTTAIGQNDSVERMRINETGVMIGGADPTHTLTLSYSGNGIALYNTADQTTNYERGLLTWASNTLTLATQKGGSGSLRNLAITSVNELRINATGTTFIGNDTSGDVAFLTGATNNRVLVEGAQTGTSGSREVVRITPTINQSGTASYTALLINPTETATGSGSKLLLDAQTGGVSKLNINNNGSINFGTAYGNPHIIPTTNELIVGHYSDAGAAFEIYSYAHATRAGEFATIYGGGPSQGQVTFIHYNGTDFNTRFAISATGDLQLANGGNIVSTTSTGTKIGTSTTQKLGFFNATPVVQQTGSVITALGNLGLVASATIAATDITSGTLPIARGGTGAGDAATARTNLAVAEASGFAKMTVGTSAPGSPAVGDLWVDTN